MDDEFYTQFEDKFRGNRQLIKDRLKVYLPLIEPLKTLATNSLAIDLGCGRGEWLELLIENGWQGVGIDTNQKIVDYCKALGLNAINEDATTYLRSLKSESIAVVTGFHIAEHLPFEVIRDLVSEAHRILLPGGFLILETPNPENIIVGTTNFYVDPTHLRPLPSQLLSFLPEYYGFHRTKILRLQESPQHASGETIDLSGVLYGVSQDYAVVAQKSAPPEILAIFDTEFENEYGLTLDTLAHQYDAQVQTKTDNQSSKLDDIQTDLQGIRSDLDTLGPENDRLQAELNSTRIDLQGLRTDLERVRADRDRLQSDLNNTRIEAQALRDELDKINSEGNKIHADLDLANINLLRLQNNLDDVFAERDELQNELHDVRAEREYIQAKLDEVELNYKISKSQLSEAQSKTEDVRAELTHVYNSRSYRITAPMRAVFGYSRVQRERFLQLRSGLAFKERLRNFALQIVVVSRRTPFIADVIEKFKDRFPRFWRRISTNVKKMINPTQPFVNITPDNSIDELHYINLFRHEITKRRKG